MSVGADIRHGWRGLLRRPAFTLTAVLTLALGIGANTAVFSAVWHVLLAPLPFAAGARMGYVWNSNEQGFSVTPSGAQLDAIVARARTIEQVEPFGSRTVSWKGAGDAEALRAGEITATLPATVGVQPLIGRVFEAEETRAGGDRVALLSEGFWKSKLGGSRDVIGSALRLDGQTYTIVGVMPARFTRYDALSEANDLYLSLVRDTLWRGNALVVLRAGVTSAQAEAELTGIVRSVPERGFTGEWRTRLQLPRDFLGDEMHRGLVVLLAAVGLLLLIACANVAGLLIVRGAARKRDLAIRAALGAGRSRLVRLLTVETLLLALAGGALGLLLGAWCIDVMRAIRPVDLLELDAMTLDGKVLVFTALLTLLTAAAFGALPAFATTRDLTAHFKATGGGSTGTREGSRAGATLVVIEMALAVTLLIGASLLVRSLLDLRARPLGFDPSGVLSVRVELPAGRYGEGDAQRLFADHLAQSMRALPGVADATMAIGVPPRMGVIFAPLRAEGMAEPLPDRVFQGTWADEAFFRVLRIPVREGRGFAAGDADAKSVIVNRVTAEKLWPGQSAVGKRIRLGDGPDAEWQTVVGVVGDVAAGGPLSSMQRPHLYLPFRSGGAQLTVALRARGGDPLALLPAVRQAVAALDAELPLRDVATLEQQVAASIAGQRMSTSLLAAFAALALLLAAVGLYGIIAFTVSRRTREIGIRVALGATPGSVRRSVLRNGAALAAGGAIAGSVAALGLTRLMAGMLHGVPAHDPLSFAAANALVISTAMLATWLPARRASVSDPLLALRSE